MKADYLLLAQTGFAVLTILCLVFLSMGIKSTFLRMGLSPQKATQKTWVLTALLVGWLGVVSVLALTGFMGNFELAPLNMIPAILPPLIAVLLVTFHPKTQSFIDHLPAKGLLVLQVFRVPVEIFLWWLFLANALPARMTFEGTNWDVLSGLAGPVFATLCFGAGRHHHKLATIYNVLGLALLLNIVLNGILTLPTPFQAFHDAPGALIMTQFPVMVLPTFLVPLAYALHAFSLRKAWLARKHPSLSKMAS
ncbi:hypothetical protein [Nibribacter koreensis]|uniref:CAAX protease self-immunity n=1 Tax=Nibribacter koreensis TaxID=1084519 RepID=A0ABP8FGB9_9BACT